MNNLMDIYHLVGGYGETYYLFEIESTGSLSYRVLNISPGLDNKYTFPNNEVMKYSLTFDNLNRLVLCYLLETGELYLSYKEGDKWDEMQIGKLDTRSNTYHQFQLIYANKKLNLIFSYSNYINSEIITIHHLVIDKGIEEQNMVIKYLLRKDYNEFFADSDEIGNIHLVYNTTTKFESYIYHSFYSPYRAIWASNPQELSTRSSDSSRPYLFIDSKSNINAAWLEKEGSQSKVIFAQMPIKGKNKFTWRKTGLNISLNNQFTPIIYEEDGSLKIACANGDSLIEYVSNDYGRTWDLENDTLKIHIDGLIPFCLSKDFYPSQIIRNLLAKTPIKSLHDLYLIEGIKKDYQGLQVKPTNPSALNTNEKKTKEKGLSEELKAQESILNEILENQVKLLIELNEIKNILSEEKPSFIKRFFE